MYRLTCWSIASILALHLFWLDPPQLPSVQSLHCFIVSTSPFVSGSFSNLPSIVVVGYMHFWLSFVSLCYARFDSWEPCLEFRACLDNRVLVLVDCCDCQAFTSWFIGWILVLQILIFHGAITILTSSATCWSWLHFLWWVIEFELRLGFW